MMTLIVLNLSIAFSQENVIDSSSRSEASKKTTEILNSSILQRGENDTIYSFFGDIPVYTLILNKGMIVKLEMQEKLRATSEYNKKGRLSSIYINDTLSSFRVKIEITFKFHPKNGRIKSGESYVINKLDGAYFRYSSKGKMKYVHNYNIGVKSGYCWEGMKHNLYRYDIYIRNQKYDSWGVFNKKHKLVAYFSKGGVEYHIK